ncbi:MAG: hypothetical protein HY794_16740 [Desulfarculus sp.]|nr:hypothetical protein [Desulfarculus sp.]
MSDLPKLFLPAPWAAGVALGLVRVIPHPGPWERFGDALLVQVKSLDFTAGIHCLLAAAKRARRTLPHEALPWATFAAPGPVGLIQVCRWVDLDVPGGAWAYEDHYNLGHASLPHPRGLLLDNPRPTWSEGVTPAPASAPFFRPGQAGLFAEKC